MISLSQKILELIKYNRDRKRSTIREITNSLAKRKTVSSARVTSHFRFFLLDARQIAFT